MAISRKVANNHELGTSGWPMLQGHLNIQELFFPSEKSRKQFKNLGDIIPTSLLEKYQVKAPLKRYVIFFKGKLYKFT
jgi:hypothetical protein